MIALLMGLLAEMVFSSVSSLGRTYQSEIDRYLERRGFTTKSPKRV